PQPFHRRLPPRVRIHAVAGTIPADGCSSKVRVIRAASHGGEPSRSFVYRTPLEITKMRPEWKPLMPLHADVIRKSDMPSPSTSPSVTASNPKVSPGMRQV